MKIIFDKDLKHIPICDNNEPLVNIYEVVPGIKISLLKDTLNIVGGAWVRREVAIRLATIQKTISPLGLVVYDAWRPVTLQKKLFHDYHSLIKRKNPLWSSKKIRIECEKFVAPVRNGIIPPHTTGGAVDISIEKKGRLLDMGTTIGECSNKSATYATSLNESEKKNRQLLCRIMEEQGFVNYPLEWWHWSYGDRYWAHILKQKKSVYGMIDDHSTLIKNINEIHKVNPQSTRHN